MGVVRAVEFGLAGVAAGVAIPVLERAVGPQVPPYFDTIGRVREVGLFTALYGATALFDGDGALWLLVGLTLLVLVRLWLWPVPGDWAYAAIAAVVGPAAEIAISATGAFDYANPDFAGIPMWLPALWANGGLLIRRLLGPVVLEEENPPLPRLVVVTLAAHHFTGDTKWVTGTRHRTTETVDRKGAPPGPSFALPPSRRSSRGIPG